MTNDELSYGWWHDEALLAEQLAQHGSINRVALANGVGRATLQRAVLRANITPGKPPAPEEKVKEPKSPRADMLMRRVRDLERDQTALNELRQSIERAAQNVVVPVAPTPPIYVSDSGPRWRTPVDIILHVSDIQYGEDVHGEDVPGGRYSPEIFRDERLPRYVDAVSAVIDAVSDQHPIGTVIFAHGGDELEGHDVFAGQAFHLAMDAGAQVATFAPVWAQAISTLAYRAKMRGAQAVAAFNVVGNHGKHGGKKAGALPASLNYDFLAMEMTRHILAGMPDGGGFDYFDERARRAVYFTAAGHVCLLSHGDQDMGGGIIGIAGVNGVKNDMAVRIQTGLNHRYHFVGHFHRAATLPVGGDSDKRWNGDWCGANNLSTGRGGGSEPMQRVYVLHPEYGISQEWPIRLAPGMSRTTPDVIDTAALRAA